MMQVLVLMVFPVLAHEWKDRDTGITWYYQILDEGTVEICNGKVAAVSPLLCPKLEIPAFVNDMRVVRIGNFALRECRNIVEVTVPVGVEVIGDNAFQYHCYPMAEMP